MQAIKAQRPSGVHVELPPSPSSLLYDGLLERVVRQRLWRALQEDVAEDRLEHGLVLRQQLAVLHRLQRPRDQVVLVLGLVLRKQGSDRTLGFLETFLRIFGHFLRNFGEIGSLSEEEV